MAKPESGTTTTPLEQHTTVTLADAWQECNRLRTRLLAEIPEAFREAASTGTAETMTHLAREAAALPAAITAAEIVAQRLAVVHTAAQLQATEARQQALRPAAEEARVAHQRALSTATPAAYRQGIPKPAALLAYEAANLAHGQAEQAAAEAPRHLAAALERALLGLPTCR